MLSDSTTGRRTTEVIEITPEMYRAGADALALVECEDYDVIIPLVYRAMRREARKSERF